jgi:opacity protein-like surface antigen
MIASTLRRAACCAALTLGMAAAAHAQYARDDTGLYVQGGWSYYNFEANDTGYSVDTNALTARLGWQFTPMLGIEADLSAGIDEGDLDFDSSEDDLDFDANNDGDFTDVISVSGDLGLDFLAGAYGRAVFPVSDRLDLSARLGYAYAEVNANAVGPGGVQIPLAEDAEDGWSAGAGISFALTEDIELRADYTWFGLDNVDVNSGTVAIGWKF